MLYIFRGILQDEDVVPKATRDWLLEQVEKGSAPKTIFAERNDMYTKYVKQWKEMVKTRWLAWYVKPGMSKAKYASAKDLPSSFRYFYGTVCYSDDSVNHANLVAYQAALEGKLVMETGKPTKNVSICLYLLIVQICVYVYQLICLSCRIRRTPKHITSS